MSSPTHIASHYLNLHWNGYLPIDPKEIARKHGIFVVEEPDLEFAGISGDCYFDSSGNPMIRYNPYESPVRQRFTIAHEFGHIMLGHVRPGERALRDPKRNYSYHEQPVEREANEFAAQLLMPESVLRAAARNTPWVKELADEFFVSAEAMSYRLHNIGETAW